MPNIDTRICFGKVGLLPYTVLCTETVGTVQRLNMKEDLQSLFRLHAM
jgi:hypothetical protein